MRIQTVAAALLAAAVLTLPAVTHAQPATAPAQPTAQQKEQARTAMDEGDKKRDAGDFTAALAAYSKADGIMNVPTTAIEVARTQVSLGKLVEAEATVQRLLKMDKKPGEPAPFTAARKSAETIGTELAARIPTLQIVATVEGNQPVTVTLDGEAVADLTTPRKVNPGPHKIVARSGTVEKTVDVTVAEKETKTVNVELKEAPKPPPVVKEQPKQGLSGAKIMMFGGFGVGAIGIGVGAVTGIMSMSKTGKLKDRCLNDRCPPGSQPDIDSATTLGNISTIAFIVGGVGAGVGVVGLLLSSKEKKPLTDKEPDAAPPPAAFRPTNIRAELGPAYAGISGAF